MCFVCFKINFRGFHNEIIEISNTKLCSLLDDLIVTLNRIKPILYLN